jgi:hypothetical protein
VTTAVQEDETQRTEEEGLAEDLRGAVHVIPEGDEDEDGKQEGGDEVQPEEGGEEDIINVDDGPKSEDVVVRLVTR